MSQPLSQTRPTTSSSNTTLGATSNTPADLGHRVGHTPTPTVDNVGDNGVGGRVVVDKLNVNSQAQNRIINRRRAASIATAIELAGTRLKKLSKFEFDYS